MASPERFIGTEFEQLTLAHSYGDGKKESCQNTVTTVSNLFDGQKIDGYMALNMDAVAILNDMVGGVPVEITSDFSAVDPSLQEGTVVTLQGDQALTFVRTRKDVDDQTNLSAWRASGSIWLHSNNRWKSRMPTLQCEPMMRCLITW